MSERQQETCEVENTIEFLSRKHMLKILKKFYDTEAGVRFSDFENINSKTLTDRLHELEDSGIIQKIIYSRPKREEYVMTDAGYELAIFFDTLNNFELKYDKSRKEEHPTVITNQ